MSEYCESADIQNRLTAQGYEYYADRDLDDSVSASEVAASVTTAIVWAGNQIDLHVPVATAILRAQQPPLLKDIAIDLAAYRFVTNGADEAPESMRLAYEDAMKLLDKLSKGMQIPGLVVTPTNSSETGYGARSYNVR